MEQATNGYGKRALVETAMGRYKRIIGRRLRARSFRAQQTEAALGAAALNRMLVSHSPEIRSLQGSDGRHRSDQPYQKTELRPLAEAVHQGAIPDYTNPWGQRT